MKKTCFLEPEGQGNPNTDYQRKKRNFSEKTGRFCFFKSPEPNKNLGEKATKEH
jgi:hypothetical protein